ncbi:MAG: DUF4394 domain-containing protein [Rhodoferax sp.]|nr:DUF4394 domain-containing protein [Rhodoferax sp.]
MQTPVNALKLSGMALATALLAACATSPEPSAEAVAKSDTLVVLTQKMELLTIKSAQPGKVRERTAVTGLPAGETLVGVDFRISKSVLFALSSAGRLYTLDLTSGALKPVGTGAGTALQGTAFGVDFNPVADRVRVVSNTGQNLRLHPDTGALAATDPAVSYEPTDRQANQKPELLGAAYTYNKKDPKLTTNYAIDRKSGTLVTQGSAEGVQPVVSPNTGLLRTVGSLGTGPLLDAAFDIADVSDVAFTAVRTATQPATQLYTVNLTTGKATRVGTLADGVAVIGMAVEP